MENFYQGKPISLDLALVVNHQYEKLFNKFEKLVLKSFGSFNSNVPNIEKMDLDAYKSFAWEQLVNAADKVCIEKIPAEKWESWGFHFQFSGYLKAYNKSMIHKIRTRLEKEQSTALEDNKTLDIPVNQEADDLRNKNNFWKAFNKVYMSLDPEAKAIWDGKLKSEKTTNICKNLGISSYRYCKVLAESKEKFVTELKKVGLDFDTFSC